MMNKETGESKVYVNFNSLYPFINKCRCCPIGHNRVLIGNNVPENLNGIIGLTKVCIEAPHDLYILVLRFSANGKLVFALCHTCVEEENQS